MLPTHPVAQGYDDGSEAEAVLDSIWAGCATWPSRTGRWTGLTRIIRPRRPPARETCVHRSPSRRSSLLFGADLDGKPERAFESISSLDRHNQEVILALLPVLTRGASANLAGDPLAAAILVDQLRVTASRLEPFAALRVETVLLRRDRRLWTLQAIFSQQAVCPEGRGARSILKSAIWCANHSRVLKGKPT